MNPPFMLNVMEQFDIRRRFLYPHQARSNQELLKKCLKAHLSTSYTVTSCQNHSRLVLKWSLSCNKRTKTWFKNIFNCSDWTIVAWKSYFSICFSFYVQKSSSFHLRGTTSKDLNLLSCGKIHCIYYLCHSFSIIDVRNFLYSRYFIKIFKKGLELT